MCSFSEKEEGLFKVPICRNLYTQKDPCCSCSLWIFFNFFLQFVRFFAAQFFTSLCAYFASPCCLFPLEGSLPGKCPRSLISEEGGWLMRRTIIRNYVKKSPVRCCEALEGVEVSSMSTLFAVQELGLTFGNDQSWVDQLRFPGCFL